MSNLYSIRVRKKRRAGGFRRNRHVRGCKRQFGTVDNDVCNEAIAHPGFGLNELGIFRMVTEQMAEFPDGGIDTVLGVCEDFSGPQALGDVDAGDKLTLARGEQNQELHRLAFEAERPAVAEQFEGSAIETEIAKFVDDASRGTQRRPPTEGKYEPVCQEKCQFKRGWCFT